MPHHLSCRVYYEDTDVGGVVYYANYFKFAERARTEGLRAAGIMQSLLLAEHGLAFAVRQVEAEFIKPARLDDLLTIATDLRDIGKASVTMHQTIARGAELLVQFNVRLAAVNAKFRPMRIPVFVREALQAAFP